MISCYFWKDGQVIPYSGFTGVPTVLETELSGLYCIDVNSVA